MKVTFTPGKAHGTVCAPPSKSYAHRELICAALAQGESVIKGVEDSEDISATSDCVRALGAEIEKTDGGLRIKGGLTPSAEKVFMCRESGSTLRFFLPLALLKEGKATFRGSERLMQRGIGIYEDIFCEKGISVEKSAGTVTVGGKLTAGEYTLRGDVSSQFVTGLLFALPLLEKDSVLRVLPPVESRGYIDITVDVLKKFGVTVEEKEPNVFTVKGGQRYIPTEVEVEKDWSNAAFLLALNEVGGEVTVTGLSETSLQADRVCAEIFRRLDMPNAVIDVSGCPDLAPILFAVAAAKHGAKFVGTRRLKIKESDRAETMTRELLKFGVKSEVGENEVVLFSNGLSKPAETLSGHNDHRIVMALSVLASTTGGSIEGAEAVKKSFPNFFDVIAGLGTEAEYEF